MNCSNNKPVIINLNVGDQLTSISCGHIISELVKFIAYHRLQIPYTYQWLKQIVNKRKLCEDDDKQKYSLQSERHYRTISSSLENLDFILKSLLHEISYSSMPEAVCIAIGGTPMTCREVYHVLLPTLHHKPQCHSPHIASDQKIQRTIFRALVTSEKLSNVLFHPIPPTNTFVFIKKKVASYQNLLLNTDNFVQTSGCRFPRNCKIIVIDLRSSDQSKLSCCNGFQVFGDVISENLVNLEINESNDNEYNEIDSNGDMKWFQSAYIMKGFKDCIVNGSSVTNTWL